MREKKGDVHISYIITGIIAVTILVIVALSVYWFYSGKAAPFFQWLGLNRTVEVQEGIEILRYDLESDKVQYYDGTQWLDFGKELRLGDKVLNYELVRKDFVDFITGVSSLGFMFNSVGVPVSYRISEGTLEYFMVRMVEGNEGPIKFLYSGKAFLSERKDDEVEVGGFVEENIGQRPNFDVYSKYRLSIDLKKIEEYRNEGGELFEHLDILNNNYIIVESRDSDGIHLSEYIFEDVEEGGYLTCDADESKSYYYKWSANEKGEVSCRKKLIQGIRFSLKGGLPDKIYAKGTRFVFDEEGVAVSGELLDLKNVALSVIFGRTINIQYKSPDKSFVGPVEPIYTCVQFKDNRYLVVDLQKSVKADEKCGGGK